MARDFRVGDWLVQPQLNLVSRAETRITIEPKVMDVLVCLAEHSGEVIPKSTVIGEVWNNSFVTDEVLTNAISALRKAFGDDAKNPRYIQTIPRRGYRLIAPVEEESTSSRFEILRELGRGAMGEVFLAVDHVLHRKVALKFLPEQLEHDAAAKKQLLREARAAAALDHPFICKTYDIGKLEGRTFIAMENVDGQTLKQRLSKGVLTPKEAVRLAMEISEALETASENGIVHRDIKPSNIMLTRQGHVKVTDFGVAKRLPTFGGGEDWTATLTDNATTRGTVPYMSPEQLRSQEVDGRSDIFSLGVVLYESLTGVNPFRRKVDVDTVNAILSETPVLMKDLRGNIPAQLEQTVTGMLEKEPTQRLQSAHEIRARLSGLMNSSAFEPGAAEKRLWRPGSWVKLVAASTLAVMVTTLVAVLFLSDTLVQSDPVDSIAVLPFVNGSDDPDQEFLGDGIAGNISASLLRLPNLRVMPASALGRYRGQKVDVLKVAEELGVRSVLTGTLALNGDTLYLTVELLDALENKLLWSEPYKRKFASIFAIQEEMAVEVAAALNLKLTGETQARGVFRPTHNTKAYEAYLRGRFMTQNAKKRGDEKKAQEYFVQAIEEDPEYALAYVGLANSYWDSAFSGNREADYPKARAAAEAALELDPDLAEAHYLNAQILAFYDRDWLGAEREFTASMELDPSIGEALRFNNKRFFFYLLWMGRREDAISELENLTESGDPLSAQERFSVGMGWFFLKEYDQALEEFTRALELDPGYADMYIRLGQTYLQKSMDKEAFVAFMTGIERIAGRAEASLYQEAYSESGMDGFLRLFRDKWTWNPYTIAATSALLGDRKSAFTWLEEAYESPVWHPFFADPRFDSLRDDPRYADLLVSLNLTP